MPTEAGEQTPADRPLRIGVDVGGTFTDLVAFDAAAGTLAIVKIPSTPPDFHQAVIEATEEAILNSMGHRSSSVSRLTAQHGFFSDHF